MPSVEPAITSTQNRWVKIARSLGRRRDRHEQRAFLVEGARAIADALSTRAVPRFMLYAPDLASERAIHTVERATQLGARVFPTTDAILRAVSDTRAPQGVVAVFDLPALDIKQTPHDPLLIVIADGLNDPGNLGTLIRSALGAGAHALYVTPETVDPYAPKVVRAAAAAHFRLPIRAVTWDVLAREVGDSVQFLGAESGAKTAYDRVDWTIDSCLIIGNEAFGLSDEARACSTTEIAIPLAGSLESLNAGVAGSIILFEAARQRHLALRAGEAGQT